MKKSYILPLFLILAFALASCENPFQSENKGKYKIAFDLGQDIYLMNTDGSDVSQLTSRPSDIDEGAFYWSDRPVWSMDGKKVAFRSYIGDKVDVFSIEINGTRQLRLTDLPERANIRSMEWSSKQGMIAIASDSGVYIADENGLYQTRLTDERSSGLRWKENGSEIVFGVNRLNEDSTSYIGEIHIANTEGEILYRFADPGVSLRFPEWMPDAESFIYVKGGWWADGGIYAYDLENKEENEIVTGFNITGIALSPNGTKIAFLHYVTLYVHDLYVSDITGENLQKLNPDQIAIDGCGSVSWSPDGKNLLIGCGYNNETHPEGYGMYNVKADGSEWLFLGEGDNPRWSSKRIN